MGNPRKSDDAKVFGWWVEKKRGYDGNDAGEIGER